MRSGCVVASEVTVTNHSVKHQWIYEVMRNGGTQASASFANCFGVYVIIVQAVLEQQGTPPPTSTIYSEERMSLK